MRNPIETKPLGPGGYRTSIKNREEGAAQSCHLFRLDAASRLWSLANSPVRQLFRQGGNMVFRSRGSYGNWVASSAMAIVLPALSLAASDHNAGASLAAYRHGPGVVNHPVHVVPSSNIHVPSGWPLSPRGEITCSTCHNQLPGLEQSGNANLRGANDANDQASSFCSNCHSAARSNEAGGMHWRALRFAHIMPDRRASEARSAGLDDASRRCLECHDGINARDVSHSNAGGGSGVWGTNKGSHPVGVAYPNGASRQRSSRYKPRMTLPSTILLPQGAVSCVSCHDLYSTVNARLTVPIEGSQLCLTCHEMD